MPEHDPVLAKVLEETGRLSGQMLALKDEIREIKRNNKTDFKDLKESVNKISSVPFEVFNRYIEEQKINYANHETRIIKLEKTHERESESFATKIKDTFEKDLTKMVAWAILVGSLTYFGYIVTQVYQDTSVMYKDLKIKEAQHEKTN